MPKVAVIQDGTELARQAYADIAGCFERSCELISADGLEFTVQIFTDEGVGFLLDQIESGDYACLVFASNALGCETRTHGRQRGQGDSLRP